MSKTEILALVVALVVLLSHIAAPQRIEAFLRQRRRRWSDTPPPTLRYMRMLRPRKN